MLAHERRTRMFLPLSPLGFFAFAVGRVAGAGAGAAGACGPSIWMHRRQSSIGVTILACSSAFASFIFEKPRSQHTVCREVVFAATVPVTTTSASAFAGAGFGFGGADSGTEGEGKGLELDGEVGLCGARGGSGGGTDVMGLANPSFVLSGAVSPAREGALVILHGGLLQRHLSHHGRHLTKAAPFGEIDRLLLLRGIICIAIVARGLIIRAINNSPTTIDRVALIVRFRAVAAVNTSLTKLAEPPPSSSSSTTSPSPFADDAALTSSLLMPSSSRAPAPLSPNAAVSS